MKYLTFFILIFIAKPCFADIQKMGTSVHVGVYITVSNTIDISRAENDCQVDIVDGVEEITC